MDFNKLDRLLRYHRQNVFDACALKADRHERALKRLKKTKTYVALCEENREAERHRASMRLLRTYA